MGKEKMKTRRILPQKTTQGIQNLIVKMSKESQYTEKGCNILGGIFAPKKSFCDPRCFKASKENIGDGYVVFSLGEKSEIEIEAKTGAVKSVEKPWYMPYLLLKLKMISMTKQFQENFDKPAIVEKRFVNFPNFEHIV
jgi:hypothetical protein